MAAQAQAVDAYYENEHKLSCHWDRQTAKRLPGMLGWPTGRVLDLGCGTGTAGVAFVESGAEVVGVDLSLSCLAVARERLSSVVRADATHLPFPDASFDAVVSRGALHHLFHVDAALEETRRVLKPGGAALFLDPREFRWLEPIKDALRKSDDSFSDDHHAYRPAEYRELIEAHFEVESVDTMFPFGILVAAGLDLLPLSERLPSERLSGGLLALDDLLGRTPLRRAGHLLAVKARRR